MICSECPFARDLEDRGRFVCGLLDTVVRGHWESTVNCQADVDKIEELEYEVVEVAKSNEEPEVTSTTYNTTEPAPKPKTKKFDKTSYILDLYEQSYTRKDAQTWIVYVENLYYRLYYQQTTDSWVVSDRTGHSPCECDSVTKALIEIRRRANADLHYYTPYLPGVSF